MISPQAIKIIAFSVFIGAVFCAGFYTKGQFVKADAADVVKKEVKDTAQGVVKGIETSQKIEETILKTDDDIAIIREKIARRPVLQKIQPEKPHENTEPSTAPSRTADVLDICTVRLLNAARQGRPVDAASCVDGEVNPAAAAAGR